MSSLPPPEVPSIDRIRTAAQEIQPHAVRTPLVRLEGTSAPEIWLKLETLQPTNSFKIRGALAAISALSPAERSEGVWTASTGNAGQGVAYAARQLGIEATVVASDTAPDTKLDRMRALGAEVVTVPFDDWWGALETHEYRGMDGAFIHPCDDTDLIAGNATIGLEILEDLPETNVVGAAVGGGGLSSGIGSAIAGTDGPDSRPGTRVIGVEPETAAPVTRSYEEGEPTDFPAYEESFVDGAGGKSTFPRMWERLQQVVDDVVSVPLDDVEDAVRVLADRTRIIAEGAGALPVAAARSGRFDADGPVVAVVSGGNIDMPTFRRIIGPSEGAPHT